VGYFLTRLHYVTLSLGVAAATAASAHPLEDNIESTLSRRGMTRSGAEWAVAVQSLDSGEMLADESADEPLKPASNLKLLTAAAALDLLGADYRIPTSVYADGSREGSTLIGDLWVLGAADPTYNGVHSDSASAALRNLADTIRQSGIRRVTGDLIIAGLFVYADGQGAVRALGGRDADALVLSTVEADHGKLTPTDLGTARVVDEHEFCREANRAAGRRLRTLLDEMGIEIEGAVRTSTRLRPPGTEIARRLSPPLSAIVNKVLHSSINLHSDLLLLHLAFTQRESLSLDDGVAVARAWLRNAGVSLDGFRMCDGSGLSHRNRMTARQLLAILRQMEQSQARRAWHDALPLAGRSGTLRHRMRGTVAEGNVSAKTGTLTGVASLSGYAVAKRTGEHVIFAVIENSPYDDPMTRARARSVVDEIAVLVATGFEDDSAEETRVPVNLPRVGAERSSTGLAIEDDFDGASDGVSWRTSRGANLQRVRKASPSGDGRVGCLVRRGQGEAMALTGPEETDAVAVEAEVHLSYNTKVNESPDVPYQGLVVRAEGDDWLRFVADFDRDKCLKVQAHIGGDWRRLRQWSFPRDFPDPRGEGWHTMRLELRGSEIRAFFDGREMPGGPIHYSALRRGRSGIYVYHWGSRGNTERVAHFDDFRIEPLTDATAVASGD
jgi:D-alanyl-D-alanine carboxypeptidase/D-alanyl-D-alanine-endopeptidase (penicillin-binding protein 4)